MIVMTDGGILKLKETYKKERALINNSNNNTSALWGKTEYLKGLGNDSSTKSWKKRFYLNEYKSICFY